MTVSDRDLAAYADGELPVSEAKRVAEAIATDPALAARLEAERRLRTTLRAHLDPVAAEPVSEALTLMIAAAAAEDAEAEMSDALPKEPARILDFAAARTRRSEKVRPALDGVTTSRRWATGGAIAAALALGLFFGTRMTDDGASLAADGMLIASGDLAAGLDRELAASDEPGKLRILTSFRVGDGRYCRVYDAGASSGIACKDSRGWTLQRALANGTAEGGEYRQAGSTAAELMAAAQDMASGDPLDAEQERTGRAKGWEK